MTNFWIKYTKQGWRWNKHNWNDEEIEILEQPQPEWEIFDYEDYVGIYHAIMAIELGLED